MAGFGRPLRAKRWKYRTSHYLRPLRSAGCIFRLDAWKSHDACGPPQVFLQGAIEHRLALSLIQSQAEQKQLARAIELRFSSGPIGGRSLQGFESAKPTPGPRLFTWLDLSGLHRTHRQRFRTLDTIDRIQYMPCRILLPYKLFHVHSLGSVQSRSRSGLHG